jgi:predicted nuclease of predicted toxin-antitoxin system
MAAVFLDSCVWGGALPVLADLGHDAVWSGAWPQDPGDSAILSAAHSERRILITLDKDFGELAIVKGLPHSGIVRLCGFKAAQMAMAIHHVVTNYRQELLAGAIITVDPERIRIRAS